MVGLGVLFYKYLNVNKSTKIDDDTSEYDVLQDVMQWKVVKFITLPVKLFVTIMKVLNKLKNDIWDLVLSKYKLVLISIFVVGIALFVIDIIMPGGR